MMKFAHGGDIKGYAKSINCDVGEVIDLSSNINFIKPKIKTDFNKLDISFYPSYDDIYNDIAKLYKVKVHQMELFNGGSSAIFTLFDSLNLKHCTIYSPAYLEYKKASEIFNYKLYKINRFDNIYQKVKQNSLVVFVNPSTPDGRYYDLKKLFKIWEKANATVLVDESFLQFCGGKSVIKYLKSYKKLYILKSMTKIYSSAGIRVGTLLSNKKNIEKLRQNQPMWKLSQFDITYLQEALKDKKFIRKSLKVNDKCKTYLQNILKKSQLLKKIHKSDANFILVQLKSLTAAQLQEQLKPYKIMVRDCSNFDFLDDKFVRIAVKEKSKLKVLEKALKQILDKIVL
ncbi:MAG: aminotransferase class I/II-fold pyridoxal phosphate-dependent enzyme [Arcobacteraceae bacterium]|nr:aminotransferase class I/II-fold pyridoxal phosphate-dependent enzyme [Arcobacteraceae bacterium]